MSLTIIGLVEIILAFVLDNAGLPATDQEIETGLSLILKIVGAVSVYVGRMRAGGLTWYGKRVSE